jgi:DNA modification methylase
MELSEVSPSLESSQNSDSPTTHETDLLIPKVAKDSAKLSDIEKRLQGLPTYHKLILGDARNLQRIKKSTVHLVVTSPPYWTLKEYPQVKGQLGRISEYSIFLKELDKVWKQCYRVLVPGGRLVIVVGDVLLSRRKHKRHQVIPLHADIQVRCRKIGFDNLAPIFWYKIANAAYEAKGNGAGFLGKPYEPNAVVKHDVEYILMERKPGGYRSPDIETRLLSVISAERHSIWFQQIWDDIKGASTRLHPAPFPEELADRLIRMFSFANDTVLDPFVGTGTTMIAAARAGRNSIGIEIDSSYVQLTRDRLEKAFQSVNVQRRLDVLDWSSNSSRCSESS